MLSKGYGSAVYGVDAQIITIEVNIVDGTKFKLTGLPDSAVKECEYRIESVLKHNGFRMPRRRIVVNLAPADVKKEGAAYDLPIALGVLNSSSQVALQVEMMDKYLIMGELALDGMVRPIKGVLPIAIEARKKGFKGFILPIENANEAAIVNDLDIIGVNNIMEAIAFLEGKQDIEPVEYDTRDKFFTDLNNYEADFSNVQGQENIKRALEIAAAGGHNVIMIGPPEQVKPCWPSACPLSYHHSVFRKHWRPPRFIRWRVSLAPMPT